MQNVDSKIIGYVLIFVGLALIAYSGFNVYQVFTKQTEPINLFDLDSIKMSLEGSLQLPAGVAAPDVEVVPANTLNQVSNVVAHLFLMGFIVNIGSKIATLGAYLSRPINVKLKNG